MKRPLKPEDLRIWSLVAATVHPLPGKAPPSSPGEGQLADGEPVGEVGRRTSAPAAVIQASTRPSLRAGHPPHDAEGKGIEPRRKHRIVRERDPIGARLDLHGLDQDRARAVLEAFLDRARDEGWRAVLVITGKGVHGDGVLRRRVPEWLGAPHLAPLVAGISEAHRRHGGEGALYVALKRKPRI